MRSAKYYSLFIILFCSAEFTTAQPKIGIKLGPAIFKPSIYTSNPNVGSVSASVGVIAGAFFPISINSQLRLQPSVELAFGGMKEKRFNYEISLPENFLNLPLNILYVLKIKSDKILIGGGPALSFLLNPDNQLYPLKTTDIGINGLISYEIPTGFSFNLNYTLGIKNVNAEVNSTTKIHNRFVAFTVGYLF